MNGNQMNTENPEEKGGLQHVVGHIKKHGLPSEAEMRAVVEEGEQKRFLEETKVWLDEYRELFNRWTSGGELTDEEMRRFTELADKNEALKKRLGQ